MSIWGVGVGGVGTGCVCVCLLVLPGMRLKRVRIVGLTCQEFCCYESVNVDTFFFF